MIISAISAIKRERNREHIYTQNIDKTHLTDLLVLVHRHHPFVGHFVVLFCLCFSPTRERDRERDREKGICSDESGIEFLPEEKRSQKVEIFQSCFFFKCCCYKNFFFLSLYSVLSLRRATSSLNFLIDGIISSAVFDGFQVPAKEKFTTRGKRVCILRPRHPGLDDGFEEVVHA